MRVILCLELAEETLPFPQLCMAMSRTGWREAWAGSGSASSSPDLAPERARHSPVRAAIVSAVRFYVTRKITAVMQVSWTLTKIDRPC